MSVRVGLKDTLRRRRRRSSFNKVTERCMMLECSESCEEVGMGRPGSVLPPIACNIISQILIHYLNARNMSVQLFL